MISKVESELNKISSKKHQQFFKEIIEILKKTSKFKMKQYCALIFVILTIIEISAARKGKFS
jgi:hypothetical protein